ncbi:MAG: 2-oxo acid dehydrogenase subunit E2 [Candidatus Bathyarchaeota archaeon]|nr:MAG: 2-oxo acid dehydrogenase subunit E2 [Candidatus Bathyarchaeota archaeon]
MVTYVKMPKLTWTMEEGLVGKWHKKVGDEIKKGEPICEIETEKSVDELEATESGILSKILVPSGSIAKINQTIAIIAGIDESLPQKEPIPVEEVVPRPAVAKEIVKIKRPEAGKRKERIKASPIARKLAQEHGINLEETRGTGPDGRIVKEDTLRAIEKAQRVKVVPLTRMRSVIKKRLSYSMKTALHVPLTIEVDMTNTTKLLETLRPEIEKTHNVRLSLTSLLVKAVAIALEDHPVLNSRLEDEQIVISEDINVGVAVSTQEGLIVPVIRNANTKSVIEIAKATKILTEKARKENLSTEENSGGTFTISNLGMFGIDLFAPIINPPESAILGVGRTIKKPIVLNDKVTTRLMMTLTVVFDHRIMDGAEAAKFLQKLKRILEKPDNLFPS